MDYDQTEIATSYDKARALAPETRRLWQDLLAADIDRAAISPAVDLGCGTGRFTELLAAHFGVPVIGVDPSRKMVQQARRKPVSGKIDYRQGSAEALPLPDGCADLVFMSMVYHHLADPTAVARECHRVLRPGGFALVLHQVVTQVTAPDWSSFIEKSALRADSFLARLSDADFQQGMAALRSPEPAIDQGAAVTEEIDWFMFARRD